jgi:multiple sugar transport system permease protein
MFEELSNFKIKKTGVKRKLTATERRDTRYGFSFIGIWIIGFLAFTLIPVIATLMFTFVDLKITDGILNPLKFVGLQNYETLIKDPQIWRSLGVTFKYGLFALPVAIFFPLLLALLLNARTLKASTIFRSLFYLPYIIPFVAAVFLWRGMLNPENGWINQALTAMGVAKQYLPRWTNDTLWVYPSYVIMGIWGVGNAMLILMSGLQSVPTELYDAAKVDGAGWWASFINITLPMISPVIFYNLTLTIVELFQYFLVPLVVNQGTGEPGGSTLFFNLILYKTFYTYQNMSYGATMAWLLFIVILAVTITLFATARFWVYYAGDNNR